MRNAEILVTDNIAHCGFKGCFYLLFWWYIACCFFMWKWKANRIEVLMLIQCYSLNEFASFCKSSLYFWLWISGASLRGKWYLVWVDWSHWAGKSTVSGHMTQQGSPSLLFLLSSITYKLCSSVIWAHDSSLNCLLLFQSSVRKVALQSGKVHFLFDCLNFTVLCSSLSWIQLKVYDISVTIF